MALDERRRVILTQEPPLWGVRPAADIMMGAVSALFHEKAIGVVLTGMGRDGAMGARAIHHGGGLCLAQDEASSVVYGMPRAAFEAGGVDEVVSLGEMAATLARYILARTGSSVGDRRVA